MGGKRQRQVQWHVAVEHAHFTEHQVLWDQQYGTWQQHGGNQRREPEFLPWDLEAGKTVRHDGGGDNGQDHFRDHILEGVQHVMTEVVLGTGFPAVDKAVPGGMCRPQPQGSEDLVVRFE
ncbi:hypothetical protein D3C79_965670 [compost metagenome]